MGQKADPLFGQRRERFDGSNGSEYKPHSHITSALPYSDTRQIRRPSRRQSASTQPIGFAQTRGLFEIVKRAQGRRDDLATRSLAVERIALAEG